MIAQEIQDLEVEFEDEPSKLAQAGRIKRDHQYLALLGSEVLKLLIRVTPQIQQTFKQNKN